MARHLAQMSKRFQMVDFKGSTQEPPSHKATACQGNQLRFGSRKAASDKKEPDPVGSGFQGPGAFTRYLAKEALSNPSNGVRSIDDSLHWMWSASVKRPSCARRLEFVALGGVITIKGRGSPLISSRSSTESAQTFKLPAVSWDAAASVAANHAAFKGTPRPIQ